MPARLITKKGLLILSWSFRSNRWESELHLPAVRDLYRVTDLTPGLTISELFDMVDQDCELKHFLGELCWCDIDAVHRRPRIPGEAIPVYPSYRAMKAAEGASPAEFLILEKGIAMIRHRMDEPAAAVEASGEPKRFELRYHLFAGRDDSKQRELVAAPAIGHAVRDFEISLEACFGTAVNLPLRLSAALTNWDRPDWQVETNFTLLEILSSIYYSLGDFPELLNADQPRVEVEIFLRESFPEYFGDE
jgi:hypothetical protein